MTVTVSRSSLPLAQNRDRSSSRLQLRSAFLSAIVAALVAAGCASSGQGRAAGDVDAASEGKCPVTGMGQGEASNLRPTAQGAMDNGDWWPEQLNVGILHQNHPAANPMGDRFDYRAAFAAVDLAALKKDIAAMLTQSQDWWPADYGNYGPLFIRLAWHSAGTYRTADGRGGAADGTIRFAPINSWPDNGNLDKARRLLWPIKKKYGRSVSWADLMILTGNVALEEMGFDTLGFAGGREDVFEPQTDVFWGPESEWLGDKRHGDKRLLDNPLAASQMGLIYVNPEGPNGVPDPMAAAQAIRTTFARMAMNDEETVALIAGGHTLGKAHGAADPNKYVGREPEGAPIEQQGLGWKNSLGSGNGKNTITSGLEGAWTNTPVQWSQGYFKNLFRFEWELTKSPAGAQQWRPKGGAGKNVPDAHDASIQHQPMMFTTDIALITDPAYRKISERFHQNPEAFDAAFASAWYKLTHRDMGPRGRLLGSEVAPEQAWQDPLPAVDHELVGEQDVAELKRMALASGLTVDQLVSTAWSSASTFRGSDLRGGANGARIRLAPQKDWAVNEPKELAMVLAKLEGVQKDFHAAQKGSKRISMADLVVLAGCAGIEEACRRAGREVRVPFTPGRVDATQAMTDVTSFAVLEPMADGFRNYAGATDRPAAEMLIDRAQLLTLSAPQMAVLVAGMRVLGANHGDSADGVLTAQKGALTNDYFVNLLDMGTVWQKSTGAADRYEGMDRKSGQKRWTATSVDLAFGSNSQLRAIAEVYASDDAKDKFVEDFIAAWTKVMDLDRFDVASRASK